jgi:hypothetical protein
MMDAITPVETRFLPALAEAISEWFPELGGRSFAVSDATISKENVPTLPLVMTAFTRSRADPPAKSNYDQFEIEDAFIVEFWLEPARYKRANGTETPFWSYYNYENVRDTLLANLIRWESPGGERVAYRTMMIEADALAVTITFGFVATFRWCSAIPVDQGQPFTLKVGLKPDTSCCIPEEPDPCQ